MNLSPEDVAKLLRIARLADATTYDGERQKSIMVCINILRDKGAMNMEEVVKALVSGNRPTPSREPSFSDFTEAARAHRESVARDAAKKAEAAKNASNFYKHTRHDLEDVMTVFFSVYTAEKQLQEINKGIIRFLDYHTFGVDSLKSSSKPGVVVSLAEERYIGDLIKKDGFELYLSEKQFNWMCTIYMSVRRRMRMQDVPIHATCCYEFDVLFKAFKKKGVPYLK